MKAAEPNTNNLVMNHDKALSYSVFITFERPKPKHEAAESHTNNLVMNHDVFITFERPKPLHEAAQQNTNNLVMNHDKNTCLICFHYI